MSDVSEFLSQSRAAHQRSFQHRGRVNQHGTIISPAQLQPAGAAIQDALRLRLEAHALDPTHSDPAWLMDTAVNNGVSSDGMIAFLGRYLTPDEARA